MADDDTPAAEEKPAPPTDDLVTTSHTLSTPTGELAYTATAGRIVLRHEKHIDGTFAGYEPHAEVFVVAYTLDGSDPGTRPVTIAFNGGPGSSSVWLHLGLFGPRRVVMGDAGALTPPPWGLTDNAESLLVQSDLVFVDPVSTGYSRAIAGGKPADFHGYTADVETIGEVIRLWVTRNERWLSPKFLAGESYGTLRAAALAAHLQDRHGMYVNGLMLISSVLDMGTIRFTEGNDRPYPLFLPTYAAIAHHHGLHPGRSLRDVLADAEEFAAGEYPWALARGTRLPAADLDRVAARLAALSRLDEGYVRRVRLRIEHGRFFRELLRGSGRTVGRIDGRFTGWEADAESPADLVLPGPDAAHVADVAAHQLLGASGVPRRDEVEQLGVLTRGRHQRAPLGEGAQPVDPRLRTQRPYALHEVGVARQREQSEVELHVGRDVGDQVEPRGRVLDLRGEGPQPLDDLGGHPGFRDAPHRGHLDQRPQLAEVVEVLARRAR